MSTRLFFVISLTILLLGCSKDQVKEDEPVEVTDLTADPASSSEDGAHMAPKMTLVQHSVN